MKLNAFTSSLLTCSLLMGSVFAAAETVHLGTSEVSKDQVINLLAPDKLSQPKTRGLRLHKDEQDNVSEANNVARSLSLEVYFEFNSANLSSEAQQQLAPVGEALASNQLSELGFTLEGHTDASGDDGYNQHLSEQRAASVKQFIVNNYAVSPDRIAATGKGEQELLEGISPTSGANRRVEIIAQ